MSLPRVLLVEDDASLRRLAELTLLGLPIELLTCGGVAEARLRLQEGPVRLLITDLMMAGESGVDLLHSLARKPALRAGAKLVVLSAGITPELRRTLKDLDVWRVLPKPASMDALEGCVIDALGLDRPDAGEGGQASSVCAEALSADQQAAIARHFAGDAALFLSFRATCLTQFAEDVREGDRAADSGDAAALRRLAHSLKSVLRTLGQGADADVAAQLESAAVAGNGSAAAAAWASLRAGLLRLARPASPEA